MKTLVVYDTKHGTSEEVAGRVAAAIESRGGEARLLDLRERGSSSASLAGFDAVALGGPFYMGMWSRRARSFAAARAAELAGKRLGIFAIGSNAALGDGAAKAALPPALAPAIVASAYVGGRYDYDRLGGLERFIVKKVTGKTESSSTLDLGPVEGFAAELLGPGASR
jgi:menaquinone-dependent protoporphyrinogen oxidase